MDLSGLFRSRDRASLPLYQQLTPRRLATKERIVNDSDASDSEDDYSYTSSPSTRDSRRTSGSHESSSALMSSRAFPTLRKQGGSYLYRLPNRIIRYLCIAMVSAIVLFILGLVRASQVENWRIRNGDVRKNNPPPPEWEKFRFLQRYYGGIRTLVPFSEIKTEYPRQEDELPVSDLLLNNTETSKRDIPVSTPFTQYPGNAMSDLQGEIRECFLDANNSIRVPPIRYYSGRTRGYPTNPIGSYELLSLPEDICFDRYGKFGPYGYGYSVRRGGTGTGEHGEREGAEAVWADVPAVDYRKIDWADVQRRCYQANAARFKPVPKRRRSRHGFYIDEAHQDLEGELAMAINRDGLPTVKGATTTPSYPAMPTATPDGNAGAEAGKRGRTAIVFRVWDEFVWREEDIMNLRSMISEVSLASGGMYDVHLLVEVKDDAKHAIWADEATYLQRIRESVPQEFWGISTLWTVTQMLSVYQGIFDLYTRGPDLPVHGSYRGLQMAMQVFAYEHPEYDYFWQWEMDIRYTGHYFDLLSKVEKWSREQPRKGLWERNARFYMPVVHGSWDDFKQMARVQTEMGTNGPDKMWDSVKGTKAPKEISRSEKTVWGPVRPKDPADWFEPDKDPLPPTTYERDKYVWGVGEEADLITFSPLFDPDGTTWLLAEDITGYNRSEGLPPRRAQIISAARLSRRLLLIMHRETAFLKHFAFSEMWPATAALQHGLKAVFAPHPVFVDREWPTEYFASVLNGGRNGASGGARTSVFGQREHNLKGLTWFYNSGFAPNFYRRWFGLKVNNDGGEEFELTEDPKKDDSTVGNMRGGEGRMCMPPMLIHPAKSIELPVEASQVHEVPESDPNA